LAHREVEPARAAALKCGGEFLGIRAAIAYVAVIPGGCISSVRSASRSVADRLQSVDRTRACAVVADCRFNDAISPSSHLLNSIDRLMCLPEERPAEQEFVSRRACKGESVPGCHLLLPGTEVAALSNASFRITPGERVALIGRVGSGKTTIREVGIGSAYSHVGQHLIDGIDRGRSTRWNCGVMWVTCRRIWCCSTAPFAKNIALGAPGSDDVLCCGCRAGRCDGVR